MLYWSLIGYGYRIVGRGPSCVSANYTWITYLWYCNRIFVAFPLFVTVWDEVWRYNYIGIRVVLSPLPSRVFFLAVVEESGSVVVAALRKRFLFVWIPLTSLWWVLSFSVEFVSQSFCVVPSPLYCCQCDIRWFDRLWAQSSSKFSHDLVYIVSPIAV